MYFVVISIYCWIWFARIKLKCWQLYSPVRYIWNFIVHPVSFRYQGYSSIPQRTRKFSKFFNDTEHLAYNLRILWLLREFYQDTSGIAFLNLKFSEINYSNLFHSFVQISTSGALLLWMFPPPQKNHLFHLHFQNHGYSIIYMCLWTFGEYLCFRFMQCKLNFFNCPCILCLSKKILLCQGQKLLSSVFL